eukprot:4037308-Pleurochrysis_carterae.AAC.1
MLQYLLCDERVEMLWLSPGRLAFPHDSSRCAAAARSGTAIVAATALSLGVPSSLSRLPLPLAPPHTLIQSATGVCAMARAAAAAAARRS